MSGSAYIPGRHLVEDREFLLDFMERHSFVDLVTATPTIRITHIPVMVDRAAGVIYGHIARANPQSETFDGNHDAVIVFRGPHSYISPSWYAAAEAVPTWNFAVVHASGKLRPIEDNHALHELVTRLTRHFDRSHYDFEKLRDEYRYGLIKAIIGFEMRIEALEGKFKLGQERSAADRAGILANLEEPMAEFTAAFYDTLPALRGKVP